MSLETRLRRGDDPAIVAKLLNVPIERCLALLEKPKKAPAKKAVKKAAPKKKAVKKAAKKK